MLGTTGTAAGAVAPAAVGLPAATSTAAGIASGAIVPTVLPSTVAATATGLSGTALAPALPAAAGKAGSLAAAALKAGTTVAGIATPLLMKPKMPKSPGVVVPANPDDAARRARLAAIAKMRGAKDSASTMLTGGGGAVPVTSGGKTAFGQ